jgi:menaquinol-cytochrome c reductase iron-sulfur subunit
MEMAEQRTEHMLRRAFIRGVIYLVPSLITAALGGSICSYLFGREKIPTETWVDAGDISDLGMGDPKQLVFERTEMDGWEIRNQKEAAWVILENDTKVTAFSPLCTHLGCAYRWESTKKEFLCPCHGSVFDIEGKVLAGPAERPLDRYATKLEGNRLWLGPLEKQKQI